MWSMVVALHSCKNENNDRVGLWNDIQITPHTFHMLLYLKNTLRWPLYTFQGHQINKIMRRDVVKYVSFGGN